MRISLCEGSKLVGNVLVVSGRVWEEHISDAFNFSDFQRFLRFLIQWCPSAIHMTRALRVSVILSMKFSGRRLVLISFQNKKIWFKNFPKAMNLSNYICTGVSWASPMTVMTPLDLLDSQVIVGDSLTAILKLSLLEVCLVW